MKTIMAVLLCTAVLLAFAGAAWSQEPFTTKASTAYDWPDQIQPSPVAEFADSIRYWEDNGGLWYFTGSGSLYAMVRFSAAQEFELQGVSMLCRNSPPGGLSFYIYEDNGGMPGSTIAVIFDFPTVVDGNPAYVLAEFNQNDYVTINGGDDFWISVQTTNIADWMPYFDDQATGSRNWYGFSPGTPDFELSGDWYITAGGQFAGGYADGEVNYLASSNGQFHQVPDTPVQFSCELTNNGNMLSQAGVVNFRVETETGDLIWINTTNVPALDPGETLVRTSQETWTVPNTSQRYVAEAEYNLPGDTNQDNNSYLLQQQVLTYGSTFARYDDTTPEINVVVSEDTGPGVLLYPPSYPASLSQIQVQLNDDVDYSDTIIRVFTVSANYALDEVWNREGPPNGLNTFTLPTPPSVVEGGFFIAICAVDEDITIPADSNPPISATNNPNHNDGGMPFASGTWLADDPDALYVNNFGNYLIRGLFESATVPDIVFPPVPFDMGEATIGQPHSVFLPFTNQGDGAAHLTGINAVPDDLQIPDQNNLPVTIPAGETYTMEVIWTPVEPGLATMGFMLEHDDPGDDNPHIVGLIGVGVENTVPATLDLVGLNTVVPASGGEIGYSAHLETFVNQSFTNVDYWTMITLPNGNIVGPVFEQTVNVPPVADIMVPYIGQAIPGYAPAGSYTHAGYLGFYPNIALNDSFVFSKLGAAPDGTGGSGDADLPFHQADWSSTGLGTLLSGEPGGAPRSAPDGATPAEYTLHEVYPNPFNPTLQVTVSLPDAAELTVRVVNVAGQEVCRLAEGSFAAGQHSFVMDGSALASGLYFVHATVPGELDVVRKAMLVR